MGEHAIEPENDRPRPDRYIAWVDRMTDRYRTELLIVSVALFVATVFDVPTIWDLF